MQVTERARGEFRRQRPLAVRIKEHAIHVLLALSLLFVIVPVILIIYFLVKQGLPAINWSFLSTDPESQMRGGIRGPIVGSIYLVVLTVIIAVPIGVLSAIYLREYAQQNAFTRAIRLAIVNLAGVPSVVYGLFGLGLFVYAMKFGISLLSSSCTLAVLTLPMIIAASEEALLTVPESFREASLALGVSKWQTIYRVILPNALPGILTGIILAIGRAAGETAPIMFTGAVFYLSSANLAPKLLEPIRALPYFLYTVATQAQAHGHEGKARIVTVQWGTALVLLVMVLGMNTVAIALRTYLRRGRKW